MIQGFRDLLYLCDHLDRALDAVKVDNEQYRQANEALNRELAEARTVAEVRAALLDMYVLGGWADAERLARDLTKARRLLEKARGAVIYERPHALVVSEIDDFLAATAQEGAR